MRHVRYAEEQRTSCECDMLRFDLSVSSRFQTSQVRQVNQQVNVLHPFFQYSSSPLAVMRCLERAKDTLVVGNLVVNSEHINFNG